tara:strand:+ start:363 stop:710 length:348 start_codon:yes stop_codon:yes gene_type:complete
MSDFSQQQQQPSNGGEQQTKASNYRLPHALTMQHIFKLSIVQDKPIMMDYWTKSLEKEVLIGVRGGEGGEKLLVKSEDEYTSPVAKIYKVETDYIIETENSLYLVDVNIPHKRIS